MPSHKVRFEICGSSYTVSTSDSEEYMLGLAKRLDEDIQQLMSKNSSVSVTTAAVMVALSFLDESLKTSLSMDNMRGQIQSYLEDAARSKSSEVDIRKELDQTRRELASYKEKLAELEALEEECEKNLGAHYIEPSVLQQPKENTTEQMLEETGLFAEEDENEEQSEDLTAKENTLPPLEENTQAEEPIASAFVADEESIEDGEERQKPEPPNFFFERQADTEIAEDYYPGQIRFDDGKDEDKI